MQADHSTLEQLSCLIDGELAAPEAAAVEAHLASCESCRAELERLRATVALLRAAPAVAPPRSFRVEQATGRASLLRFPTSRLISPAALRAFAGMAAALTVVLLFVADASQPVASPTRAGPALAPALAPAVESSSADRAAARQEPRALAPQGSPASAGGAGALQAAPASNVAEQAAVGVASPAATPGATSDGVISLEGRARLFAEPSPGPSPSGWASTGRLAALGLAAAAAALVVVSFLVRRKAST